MTLYGLFQTANNTAVMNGATSERRGVTSALLGLSRNLGLITGASAMGAVFAFGSRDEGLFWLGTGGEAGLRLTFAVVARQLRTRAVTARVRSGVNYRQQDGSGRDLQGGHVTMHDRMMRARTVLDLNYVLSIAQSVGLDGLRLIADLQFPETTRRHGLLPVSWTRRLERDQGTGEWA